MQAEGMVHALALLHDLLVPDGTLIDIHPLAVRPELFVCFTARSRSVGAIEEQGDLGEYRQAQAALDEAARRGLYTADYMGEFLFITHAASLDELQEHLAENWKDAIIRPAVAEKARALCACSGAGELQLVERVAITRLRRRAGSLQVTNEE